VTFEDYLRTCESERLSNRQLRTGQTYFNVLYRYRPVLADGIRGGELDPFYTNARLPRFLRYVQQNWTETAPVDEQPQTPARKVGACSVCGHNRQLTNAGKIWPHGGRNGAQRCPGSGEPPKAKP
jgi:hypothetical protein